MTTISLTALLRAVSQARFDAFRDQTDADDIDTLARYLWNMALATHLAPTLHVIELTLRNAIYLNSLTIVDATRLRFYEVPVWLDANPSLLLPQELETVRKAKDRLRKRPNHLTTDRLVAQLTFDFWAALCNAPYEQGRADGPKLWPALERLAFAHAPKHLRNRATITRRVHDVKDLRNHVAHHSRLYHPDFDLPKKMAEALDLLSWMNLQVHGVTAAHDRTLTIYQTGPAAYRTQAATILHVAPPPPTP